MTNAIHVEALTHSYSRANSRTVILDGIDMTVPSGQSVALIGRSGSGKSTLLNLISGLEPVTVGNVSINGQSLLNLNDHQRTRLRGEHIGFIYQAFNLIHTLSVKDNVALPLALSGVSSSTAYARVRQLMGAVGLAGREEDYPDRLSGGEQQRVAIARALVHEPALILADEPTGNLDANSGRQVMQLLGDLVQQQGSAMLLVTHSQEVARSADSALLLNNGQIEVVDQSALEQSAAW